MSDSVLQAVCRAQEQLRPLYAINLVLFVLLLLLMPFVERGSGTFVVTVLGLVIIGGTSLGWTLLRYRCKGVEAEQAELFE